jgi:hypothetical protein
MNWMNYLYIDSKRVNAYYKQISSSNAVDVREEDYFSIWPKWALNDLQVESLASQPAYTLQERIHAVRQHIERSNQFSLKRHHYTSKGRDFVYYQEVLTAQKVYINEKLSFWISENIMTEVSNKKHGHLILIEGFAGANNEVKFHSGWSTASMLSFYRIMRLENLNEDDTNTFNLTPIQYFSNKDYLVSEPKTISVIYRLITTCRDEINGLHISSLGYPIAIAEDPEHNSI